jgi:hypothetical protein
LVFLILFSLALVLLALFGEVGSLALYLSEFWPLLVILFAFVALGIAAPNHDRSPRRRAD